MARDCYTLKSEGRRFVNHLDQARSARSATPSRFQSAATPTGSQRALNTIANYVGNHLECAKLKVAT
jgi:hypothetical protein